MPSARMRSIRTRCTASIATTTAVGRSASNPLEVKGFGVAHHGHGGGLGRLIAVRDGTDEAVAGTRGIQHGRGCRRQGDDPATTRADDDLAAGVVVHAARGRRAQCWSDQRGADQQQRTPGRNAARAIHRGERCTGESCEAQPSQPEPAARVMRGFNERSRQANRAGCLAAQASTASRLRIRQRAA